MFALPHQKSNNFDEVIERLDGQAGSNTWAGATVTVRSALQQATVYASVRILSETIGTLPIKVQTRNTTGQWVDSDHNALGVLQRPNDWMTQHDLVSMWVAWAELHGNAYNLKALANDGEVRYLYPLQSTGVTATQLGDWSLHYNVSAENGFSGQYGADRILHIRNFGTNGFSGVSTIGQMRQDIGLAERAKEHGARVFMNGASASKWIKAPGVKNAEQAKEMQTQFHGKYAGAQNSGIAPVMWGGSELMEMGMTASDAQLLETLKFQKQEIAGWFGVPLFLLNDTEKSTTWGTGLEQITKSFMRFSLRPRLDRICGTLCRELISPADQRGTRFVFETDAFTMGGFKEVMEAAEKAISSGVLNPNEAREMINRNPREDGDVYRESPNSVPEGSDPQESTE